MADMNIKDQSVKEESLVRSSNQLENLHYIVLCNEKEIREIDDISKYGLEVDIANVDRVLNHELEVEIDPNMRYEYFKLMYWKILREKFGYPVIEQTTGNVYPVIFRNSEEVILFDYSRFFSGTITVDQLNEIVDKVRREIFDLREFESSRSGLIPRVYFLTPKGIEISNFQIIGYTDPLTWNDYKGDYGFYIKDSV